jgi:glutaredoxin
MFVGEGCPHCKKVQDFVASSGVDKKFSFDIKEVWYNQSNALIMNKVWQHCGLNSASGGMSVPLLWDGQVCYSGDEEIISYLKTKL